MEPRIQYAKTADGVSIAFATYGEGRPLVWSQQPLTSHVQLEWQVPVFRPVYAAIAAQGMLVRFDTRGVGLSDRDAEDVSLEARVSDLQAVVEHLELKRFALLAVETGGLPAIAYAARFPEQVSHLVLLNCYARGEVVWETGRGQALIGLVDDWEMLTENIGAMAFGYGWEGSRRYAEFVRQCITPEMMVRMNRDQKQIDLSDALASIEAPTLVVRHNGIKWVPMEATRELAAGIPNARLHMIEGFYLDNPDQLWRAVNEFLDEGAEAAAGAPALATEDVHTILFTDVEGSTAMTQRLGDAKARDLLREHERIVREALKAHGGAEVKTMGDGFMTSFSSAVRALECAIVMQRAFADWNAAIAAHPEHVEGRAAPRGSTGSPRAELKVRIGLNAGEPIAEDDPDGRSDLFGTAVNEAARITSTAKGGEILVSDVVRQLAKGKDFLFADRGETSLKGFDEPVRLFEVRWQEE